MSDRPYGTHIWVHGDAGTLRIRVHGDAVYAAANELFARGYTRMDKPGLRLERTVIGKEAIQAEGLWLKQALPGAQMHRGDA